MATENSERLCEGVLSQFVERARSLYSLPTVALRVLELSNHPTLDVRQLKDVIETDPALVARVLRIVNSSLYGLRGRIGDLNQAIALLGVKAVNLLVLGFSLPPNLFEGLEGQMLEQYWRHTLIKSVAARELNRSIFCLPNDEAFTAALLQDIGVLVLAAELGESYAEFYSHVYEFGGELAAHENATLGFDHCELSSQLLSYWGLPHSIVHAVGMPHDMERLKSLPEDAQAVPQILHLSELIARLLHQTDQGAIRDLLHCGAQYRGITMDNLRAVIERIEQAQPALASAFDLPEDQRDYQQIIQRAYDSIAQHQDDLPSHLGLELHGLRVAARESVERAASAPAPAPVATATMSRFERQVEEPGLLGQATGLLAASRMARQPISLLLLGVDHYEELVVLSGADVAEDRMQRLAEAVDALSVSSARRMPVDERSFALLLRNVDRDEAVSFGREVIDCVERWITHGPEQLPVTISIGVAALSHVPKNYPPEELLEAAQRCLYGAEQSGGNSLKSISLV